MRCGPSATSCTGARRCGGSGGSSHPEAASRSSSDTPFKAHKITDEDWRNRDKWDAYNVAVCEMFDRTSTEHAPWTLVEANDKYFARLKVLRTLADAIEEAL